MRAAACLLSLALCALPAAPGEQGGPRGLAGGRAGRRWGGAEPVTLTAAASPCSAGSGPAAAGRRRGENRFAERQSIRPLRLLAGEGGGGARRPALSTRVRSGAVRSQVGASRRDADPSARRDERSPGVILSRPLPLGPEESCGPFAAAERGCCGRAGGRAAATWVRVGDGKGSPRNAGGELSAGICLACCHPDRERSEISASHRPAAAGFIALNAAVLVPVAEHRV